MATEIGIMQGRLLPMLDDRYQGFPGGRWQKEFALAKQAKLSCIEWVYDDDTENINPIGSESGIEEISRLVDSTGVEVRSLCGNYFMVNRLVGWDGTLNKDAITKFNWLVKTAKEIGVVYIVLPLLEESALSTTPEIEGVITMVDSLLPSLELAGIELLLETDLSAEKIKTVLEEVNHSLIGINYDIGNSASIGYKPVDELRTLSHWVRGVHVKDRVYQGGTVPLGCGDADFETSFRMLLGNGFDRWFVLEAARRKDISEFMAAEINREFVEDHLNLLSREKTIYS